MPAVKNPMWWPRAEQTARGDLQGLPPISITVTSPVTPVTLNGHMHNHQFGSPTQPMGMVSNMLSPECTWPGRHSFQLPGSPNLDDLNLVQQHPVQA